MSNDRNSGASGGDPYGGSEEPTVPEATRGDIANAIRGLGIALESILRECREAAFVCDLVEGHERIFRILALKWKLGQLREGVGEAEVTLGRIAEALDEQWKTMSGL